MYQEWMDAVPILVSGYYEHNIKQLQKAKNYYTKHNNLDMANFYQSSIDKEQNKLKEEINKPNKFKQILNIIFN